MNKVTIYTTDYCPYCQRALHFLQQQKIEFEQIKVDNNDALRQELAQLSGRTTVPQIFINDKPIGGCDDLLALAKSGKLAQMLGLEQTTSKTG